MLLGPKSKIDGEKAHIKSKIEVTETSNQPTASGSRFKYLSMEIDVDEKSNPGYRDLVITQEQYTKKLISKFGNGNAVPTPAVKENIEKLESYRDKKDGRPPESDENLKQKRSMDK